MFYVTCARYLKSLGSSNSSGSPKVLRCYSKLALDQFEPPSVSPSEITAENQYDCLARVVTPLWQLPYSEQLKLKYKWSQQIVQNLKDRLHKVKGEEKKKILKCNVHPVKPSPVTEHYRNKDEFNIRTGVDGNPKTVGLFVGSPAEGPAVCVRGTHLINIRKTHIQVAKAFEDYIETSSVPACHHFSTEGWYRLVVRSNQVGQMMAIAILRPLEMGPDRLDEEADKLKDYFLHGAGSQCNLTSLLFQACPHTRCTAEQAPYKLLLGDTHHTETLGKYKFQISPDSFFQANTAAAEVLYSTAVELADVTPMTTLLDVCSGTGTVSIFASQYVRGAIGVESVHNAVTDARHNALLNKVYNVEFVSGLAEKKIPTIISDLEMASDIVAIVNPTRSGLNSRVIKTLCKCPQIKHVIYISCKADHPQTMSNFVQLHTYGNFSLKKVVPVDLFPHTVHTELVMSFRR